MNLVLKISVLLSIVATSWLAMPAWARGPALANDVSGIRLGDPRSVEADIDRRAKPWLRVYYDANDQVQGVLYRQPGLGNSLDDQRALVAQICNKYGSANTYCNGARDTIAKSQTDDEIRFTGFTALYTVDGGFITARLKREKAFSLFPRLMVEIELRRDGFDIPN